MALLSKALRVYQSMALYLWNRSPTGAVFSACSCCYLCYLVVDEMGIVGLIACALGMLMAIPLNYTVFRGIDKLDGIMGLDKKLGR
jgi:hypothetical protein